MISDVLDMLEPISKVFKALLHPIQTINSAIDVVLAYIPAVCSVIFLFYIVTGSRKVLSALFFTILVFILLKASLVLDMTWLFIVVVAAILIIRLIGVVM